MHPATARVNDALQQLSQLATPVAVESVSLNECIGRVLADDLRLDRDSPAADVSAMDGYAVRFAEFDSPLSVTGIAAAGDPLQSLPLGTAMQIFTGGVVPTGADTVIKREDVVEVKSGKNHSVSQIIPRADLSKPLALGDNIRLKGENAVADSTVLTAGSRITPPVVGLLATCGQTQVKVHRRVKIIILNTGEEILDVSAAPKPWQLRDSNGPWLESFFQQLPWCEIAERRVVRDQLKHVQAALEESKNADVIVLTGGVSMGDSDYVPQAIESQGSRVVFHRLPLRPGKPLLGAVSPSGQICMGLPGNPGSVAATARAMLLPALRIVAGDTKTESAERVTISNPDSKRLDLVWFQPVKKTGPGIVEIIPNRGSGDVIGLGQSDGIIRIDPGENISERTVPFLSWETT